LSFVGVSVRNLFLMISGWLVFLYQSNDPFGAFVDSGRIHYTVLGGLTDLCIVCPFTSGHCQIHPGTVCFDSITDSAPV
jgi:hypothetical protein